MKENRTVGGVWQNKEKEGTALACNGIIIFKRGWKRGQKKDLGQKMKEKVSKYEMWEGLEASKAIKKHSLHNK